VGDGIKQQLSDLYASDVARKLQGKTPLYLLESVGLAAGVSNGGFVLFKVITSPAKTLITLTISADNLQYIVNNSPGKINSAYVDPFEAFSRSGYLHAMITNTGRITSSYSLSVTECSPNIQPMIAQQASLAPFQSTWLLFNVRSNVDLATNNVCTVSLYDSLGAVVDSLVIQFNTTDTKKDSGTQSGIAPNVTAVPPSKPNIGSLNAAACDGCAFFDVSCKLMSSCVAGLLKSAAAVLLPVAGVLLLLKLCMTPGVRRACSLMRCFSCLCGGGGIGTYNDDAETYRKRNRSSSRAAVPVATAQPLRAHATAASTDTVFFNVARPDAPFSVPGKLLPGGVLDGGAAFVFVVDSRHALFGTMGRTQLNAAQAKLHVTKFPLY
jgi:hypothetical protein